MTPSMHKRVRDLFVDAGLTTDYLVQMLKWTDTGKLTDAFIVFRPSGGTDIDEKLSSDYYVSVDIISAKNTGSYEKSDNDVQIIIEYIKQNPLSNLCVGQITNVGGVPSPVMTTEERMVWRLLFSCRYGE